MPPRLGLKDLGAALNFSQFVLLPTAEPWPVVRVTAPGEHETVAELTCSLEQRARIQDARRATALSAERDRVDIYEWAAGTLGRSATLALPPDMYATDVVLKGAVLFVCGGYRWPTESTDVLLARPLEGGDWTALDIPADVQRPGVVIDALLLDGDRLIAVADHRRKKWFLEYDVREPARPRIQRTPELLQEPSELVHGAVLGTRFIALRSTAYEGGRLSQSLRLYDRHTLVECAYFSTHHPVNARTAHDVSDPLGRRTLASDLEWRELAFVGDRLLIAGGLEGLGVLDTASVRTLAPVGPQQRRPAPIYLGEEVRFEACPPGRETISIVPVPAHGGAFVVEAIGADRSVRWSSGKT